VTHAENGVEALNAAKAYVYGETAVKKVLALAVGMVVIVVATALAEGTTDDKKAEVIVHTVTADEIAKEFKGDPKEAMKKYDPRPPKQGAAYVFTNRIVQTCAARPSHKRGHEGTPLLVSAFRAANITEGKTSRG
jgi:hypothetical protein